MQTQKKSWSAILLTALFGLGTLLLWGLSAVMGIIAVIMLLSNKPDAVASMTVAASLGFLGALLLAAAAINLLKILGNEIAEKNARLPYASWHALLAALVMLISIGGGALALKQQYLSIILIPMFTLSGVVAPLWFIVSTGIRKLEVGSCWHVCSIFGLGLSLGPLLMTFLEIMVGIAILLGATIYITVQPGMADKMVQFAGQLQAASSPEQTLALFSPYLLKPAAITLILAYTSIAIPMIEELLKPVGVWLFARQLKTPTMGFAMGILSGAAYAVVENIGMITQAGSAWTMIILVRTGAGLLHITNTGLMGWAIVSLVNEKKTGRFFLTYIGTIIFHGMWNCASVGFFIYSVAQELGITYTWVPVSSAAVLAILIMVFPVILIGSNHRFGPPTTTDTAAPAAPS